MKYKFILLLHEINSTKNFIFHPTNFVRNFYVGIDRGYVEIRLQRYYRNSKNIFTRMN